MRNPQWAIERLHTLANRVEARDHSGASDEVARLLRARANRIHRIHVELVEALCDASKGVRTGSEYRNREGDYLITPDEARDFSDGIFDQRSYR